MTNQSSAQVTQPHMATKLPIIQYETHITTKIHVETIHNVILARSLQDQPSPSKFSKIDQCVTSQLKFYVCGTYLITTHDIPHPPKRETG